MARYSIYRLWAMMLKEFIQMKRDRATLGMIIGIPLIQIILYGYSINIDPKRLPIAVVTSDYSTFTRDLIQGLENTNYFKVTKTLSSEEEGAHLLAIGEVQFILNIPNNFTRDLIRGYRPSLLLEADATDPAATSNAIAAVNILPNIIFAKDLQGSLSYLNPSLPPIDFRIHAKYNPSAITQYNIVPGLIGVVLTMTMIMITAIAMTRERERGTLENLLAIPIQPLEVMLGKVIPYIIVGYIQLFLIVILARFLFSVPVLGSILLLLLAALPFIAANLSIGLLFSTLARNQLQAVQMSVFFFLPSILLSGFMFPFRGMPMWAQALGEILPLTHFVRITRGIMLKGNGLINTLPEIWPILLFLLAAVVFGAIYYRRTLD